MSELIKKIKDLSHQVSEDYLLLGKDMNDSLSTLVQKGEIENMEILKRICEQANQNVYLALFHNPETNKANIVFDLAKFDQISTNAKESEQAMKDYNTPPEDFRSGLEIVITSGNKGTKSENEKLGELNEVVEYRQVMRNLLNRVGIMKTAEEQNAENSFNRMAHDAKILVSNGDSLGDISKIAVRFVKEELEGDFVKMAKCYDLIHKELVNSNFNVKTGFTKLSSKPINSKSQVLLPVRDFSMSMAKIAGLNEMKLNIENKLKSFDKVIAEA